MTGKRARAAVQRLREVPDLGRWREGVARGARARFTTGGGPRGWVASIDWLLRPDTLTKIEEGAYDDSGPGAHKIQAPRSGRYDNIEVVRVKQEIDR